MFDAQTAGRQLDVDAVVTGLVLERAGGRLSSVGLKRSRQNLGKTLLIAQPLRRACQQAGPGARVGSRLQALSNMLSTLRLERSRSIALHQEHDHYGDKHDSGGKSNDGLAQR